MPLSKDKQINTNNEESQEIPVKISDCEELIKKIFKNSSDVIIQTFDTQKKKAMLVYIDGLINKDIADRDIISTLKSTYFNGNITQSIKSLLNIFCDIPTVISQITDGNIAVFYEESKKVICIDVKQWSKRTVEIPEAENVTRGPKEGFIEDIRTNTSLIRRKIKNPNLVFEKIVIGKPIEINKAINLIILKRVV